MSISSMLLFLSLVAQLSLLTATPVVFDISSTDSLAQLDTDGADLDGDRSLHQTSQDTVALNQADQLSYDSTITDLSWLTSSVNNDPEVPLPVDVIAEDTTHPAPSCEDAIRKRSNTGACPVPTIPGTTKPEVAKPETTHNEEDDKKPNCSEGKTPFCCSHLNSLGNPVNCLKWGYVWGPALPVMCLERAGGIIKCCKYLALEEGHECVDPV